jgi:hypothetical protein
MLPTNRSAIAFARGAWSGGFDHLDAGAGEDGVERRGELGVPISDQEPEVLAGFVQVHCEVAGQLSQPGAGRVGGDAEDVDLAGGVFDDEERVEPGQGDGPGHSFDQRGDGVIDGWATGPVRVGPLLGH